MDLKTDILIPVAKRIRERADSLRVVKRFPRSGIEGWLKVEAVAALGDKVKKLQNKGPDLVLQDDLTLELKGATDLNPSWIKGGALKYNAPCLFLGDGRQPERIAALRADGTIELIGYEVFSDGNSEWVVGIISPIS